MGRGYKQTIHTSGNSVAYKREKRTGNQGNANEIKIPFHTI